VVTAWLVSLLFLVACEMESDEQSAVDQAEAAPGKTGSDESSTGEEPESTPTQRQARRARVLAVVDGDTLELRSGKRVRLVQIDAPEASGECFGAQAGRALSRMLPPGTRVQLERDPLLDNGDRYGRLLRYVHKGGTNVNLELIRRGAASVWYFDGDRGRYADVLLEAARKARRSGRGAWGACRAKLDPSGPFDTRPKRRIPPPPRPGGGEGSDCMAGYTPCLPIVGDLDCADVRALGKAPVRVTGSDPYRLDGDDEGLGCE